MAILKTIAVLISVFVLVAFTVFLVNQTAQVVSLAETFRPGMGQIVLWSLLAIYAVLLLTPLYLWLKMPARLTPPEREDSPEFERHLTLLSRRLSRNPRLKHMTISDRIDVERALKQLDSEVDSIVNRTAAAVFLSTAVSQSGRLDVLMVLATQVKMVWQVAHVYHQRPSVREMLGLYANVAGTSFIAGEIDDIEVEPLVAPVLGATLGSIPGLQQVTAVLVRSALSGAANAFLTLRVGMITRQYCAALVIRDKRSLRRFATAQAASRVGKIVRDGASRISKEVWSASTQRMWKVFPRSG